MSDFPIEGTAEQVAAYCKAMHEMQSEFGSVPKNAIAKVGKGGEREFKFTDYDCLVEYLRPFFAKHGFFHFARPGSTASKTTAILHAEAGISGEVDSAFASGSVTLAHKDGAMATAFFAMPCADPRDAGKIITYFRRYLLGSLAGVSSDEDTDAEGVGNPPPQQAQKARQEPAKQGLHTPAPSGREMAQGDKERAKKGADAIQTYLKGVAANDKVFADYLSQVSAYAVDTHGLNVQHLVAKGWDRKVEDVYLWAKKNIGAKERRDVGQEIDRPDEPGFDDPNRPEDFGDRD